MPGVFEIILSLRLLGHRINAPLKQPKIKRVFSKLSKTPFQWKISRKLIKQYCQKKTLDLFPYPYKFDALDEIKKHGTSSLDCILKDPPYSNYQLKKQYDDKGLAISNHNRVYFGKLDREIKRVVKPGGIVITWSWNSKRIMGFELQDIILCNHGSMHNDTIITIQKKMNHGLEESY